MSGWSVSLEMQRWNSNCKWIRRGRWILMWKELELFVGALPHKWDESENNGVTDDSIDWHWFSKLGKWNVLYIILNVNYFDMLS